MLNARCIDAVFILQEQPEKVCSKIGLCDFDGTQGVRLDFLNFFSFLLYFFCLLSFLSLFSGNELGWKLAFTKSLIVYL